MVKVLIVATSRKTRGGITSVVKAYEDTSLWKKYHCYWIQTHRDGNALVKVGYLISAIFLFSILLPFYDIVHVHYTAGSSLKRKGIFIRMSKFFHKKVILHFHPAGPIALEKYHDSEHFKEITMLADKVLVLSDFWKKVLEERVSPNLDIDVLFNPAPNVQRKNIRKQKQILFAGSINHRKRYEVLIKGFAHIYKKYPDWNLVFAGNGELEKAQSLVKQLKLEGRVRFLGWISGDKKDDAFSESSIYCLPSEGEGFPMGVMDAWAYEIPCVVTPVGGIETIIEDKKEGLIVPVDDDEALANSLSLLIESPALRDSIVSNTNKLIKTTFNIDNLAEQLGGIYQAVQSSTNPD